MIRHILYSDDLVEIADDSILFRHYYFPFGSKRIMFSDVGHISMEKPSLLNGKYRIHGTGDLRTWYPCDLKRPIRDRIFFVTMPHRWLRIGFTVEDSGKVENIFREKHLLESERRAA